LSLSQADFAIARVRSTSWIIAIETGKIMAGVSCAVIAELPQGECSLFVRRLDGDDLGFWIVVIGANKLVRNASNSRLRKIRSELAVGLEFLCIFLEGGQQSIRRFDHSAKSVVKRCRGLPALSARSSPI